MDNYYDNDFFKKVRIVIENEVEKYKRNKENYDKQKNEDKNDRNT